jgi:hypothetical protein
MCKAEYVDCFQLKWQILANLAIMHGFEGSVDFLKHCWRASAASPTVATAATAASASTASTAASLSFLAHFAGLEGVVLPGAMVFFSVQQLAMQAVRRCEGTSSGRSDC